MSILDILRQKTKYNNEKAICLSYFTPIATINVHDQLYIKRRYSYGR